MACQYFVHQAHDDLVGIVCVTAAFEHVLIGPGRWGSADRWLGIPVGWNDISGVGAIIEATHDKLQADPSQGTHFFHNITSLGISYITITGNGENFIDWQWLKSLPPKTETAFLKHLRLDAPLTIKIDGRKSRAVLIKEPSFQYCDQTGGYK